jgi:predicted enzyme related to lactoylglutathione lyase
MSQAGHEKKIDYIEFCVKDVGEAKRFYGELFGWKFQDWGPEYVSFTDGRLEGGFRGGQEGRPGGTLAILYTARLEAMQEQVQAAGGTVVRPIFSFPGGRRFHFTDPSGNELAVWSDV